MDVTVQDTNRDHHRFHDVDEVEFIVKVDDYEIHSEYAKRVLLVNPATAVAVFIEGRKAEPRNA